MKAAQQVHYSQRQERQQLSGLSPRKGKDKSSLASQTSAQREFSQLRHISLNILQKEKKKYESIKGLRKFAGWHEPKLKQILLQNT